LKLGRRCQSLPSSSSPPLSLPPRLPRAVRKQYPPPFYLFPSRMLRRRSPAAGRPPPLALRLGRRLNYSCMHLFSFASLQASRRCIPRAKPWPKTLFSAVVGDPPPRASVRRRPATCGRGRPLDQPWTARISPARGSILRVTVNLGCLC
jgi:hypothetical protein